MLSGLFGSLLVYVWAFSDHLVAHENANLLLTSPLNLIAGVAYGCSTARWARAVWIALGAGAALLVVLWSLGLGIHQDVSLSAALFAPVQISLALLFLVTQR